MAVHLNCHIEGYTFRKVVVAARLPACLEQAMWALSLSTALYTHVQTHADSHRDWQTRWRVFGGLDVLRYACEQFAQCGFADCRFEVCLAMSQPILKPLRLMPCMS